MKNTYFITYGSKPQSVWVTVVLRLSAEEDEIQNIIETALKNKGVNVRLYDIKSISLVQSIETKCM